MDGRKEGREGNENENKGKTTCIMRQEGQLADEQQNGRKEVLAARGMKENMNTT